MCVCGGGGAKKAEGREGAVIGVCVCGGGGVQGGKEGERVRAGEGGRWRQRCGGDRKRKKDGDRERHAESKRQDKIHWLRLYNNLKAKHNST